MMNLRGFQPIYQKELAYWFKSYRWMTQLILWLSLTTVPAIWITPNNSGDRGVSYLTVFLWLSSSLLTLGTILMAQNTMIEEKLSQTLLWIWSKPLSAVGFILGKFAAFAVWVATIGFGIPALCTLIAAVLAGLSNQVSILNYGFAIVLIYVFILFHLALTLMLGTIFERVSLVSGSAIFIFFAGMSLTGDRTMRRIEPFTAWALPRYAATTVVGKIPAEVGMAIAFAGVMTIGFLAIATWRMKRYEF